MKPIATVLVPTHDHGPTILRAVETALRQTVSEIEVFIVGDGVPDAARAPIAALTQKDPRVRFFDNPKGPRHGEIHRHQALAEASGEIVCYLADDDLWFPDHVETMHRLLQRHNFVGARTIHVDLEGKIGTHLGDFAAPYWVELLVSGKGNFVGLSSAAHTLALYRRLPHGWRTTPEGIWTDMFMWQQVLSHPDCRPASAPLPTVLNFPAGPRKAWTTVARLRELDAWLPRLADPAQRLQLEREFTAVMLATAAAMQAALRGTEARCHALEAQARVTETHVQELRAHAQALAAHAQATETRAQELQAHAQALEARCAAAEAERESLAQAVREMQSSATFRLRRRLERLPVAWPALRWVARMLAGRGSATGSSAPAAR